MNLFMHGSWRRLFSLSKMKILSNIMYIVSLQCSHGWFLDFSITFIKQQVSALRQRYSAALTYLAAANTEGRRTRTQYTRCTWRLRRLTGRPLGLISISNINSNLPVQRVSDRHGRRERYTGQFHRRQASPAAAVLPSAEGGYLCQVPEASGRGRLEINDNPTLPAIRR